MSTTTQGPCVAMGEGATGPTGATERGALLGQVAQQLTLVQRVVKLAAKELMAEHNISPHEARMGAGQYHALGELAKVERLMAGELADRCHVSEPTVSKMLKSLEANGFVQRQTDPANRRVVWVTITPAGRDMRDKFNAHFHAALVRVLDGLDDAQLTDLARALGHLDRLVEEFDTQR